LIKTFVHKGIEAFFLKGTKAGIQTTHAAKLGRQLAQLNQAATAKDMNLPGWKLHELHELKGDLAGHWAVSVNGNWRLTFKFEEGDAILVDYQDYH
jgi:proteic killer suppression protein